MGLLGWWKERRQWRQDNFRSWDGRDSPLGDGWTKFQVICLEALTTLVDVTESRVEGTNEKYITGRLRESNANYYIYEDGAELSGKNKVWRLERWDFRTLDKLVKQFSSKAKEMEVDS